MEFTNDVKRWMTIGAMALPMGCMHPSPPVPEKPAGRFDYVGALALRANQPKELARWYTEKLGLPMTMEFPGGVAGGFRSGNVNFNMAIVESAGKHPGSAPGTAYFVLHVGDFDRILSDLKVAGLIPFEQTSDAMGRFASFRDPEGNEVSIWGK
jgi:hypothetical protein